MSAPPGSSFAAIRPGISLCEASSKYVNTLFLHRTRWNWSSGTDVRMSCWRNVTSSLMSSLIQYFPVDAENDLATHSTGSSLRLPEA